MTPSPPPFALRLLVWTFVCGGSAVPSFVFGMGFDRRAMILGIAVFVMLYTMITGTDRFLRLRRRSFVDRVLLIGFGTRLMATIIFPLGMFLDVWPGMISVGIVQRFFPEPETFVPTLAITLIQGTLLNVLLACWMVFLYVMHRAFAKPAPPPEGICLQCGYDLRAS